MYPVKLFTRKMDFQDSKSYARSKYYNSRNGKHKKKTNYRPPKISSPAETEITGICPTDCVNLLAITTEDESSGKYSKRGIQSNDYRYFDLLQ